MVGENVVLCKSTEFAIRIVKMCKHLKQQQGEVVMSHQLLKCGTSIGANLTESSDSISHAEFISKTQISLKECSETLYWLYLLVKTDYISQELYESLSSDAKEIRRLLVAILRTAKSKPKEW
jgi:four helix bundle protein